MRTYANGPEQRFAELARRNGWEPAKRGWPDFLCYGPQGELIAVEVKPRLESGAGLERLKREQEQAMAALSKLGVRCFVSDGETLYPYKQGTVRYGAETPARPPDKRPAPGSEPDH